MKKSYTNFAELTHSEFIEENKEMISEINKNVEKLNRYSDKLLEKGIDIKKTPWYKNIFEIYLPDAIDYSDKFKDIKFYSDFLEGDLIWMRRDFKSFMSEVEKFIKFIVKKIFNKKSIDNFSQCVNIIDEIIEKYKHLFDLEWVSHLQNVKFILNIWRKNYNENKHKEDKMDDSYFVEGNKLFDIDKDPISFLWQFICKIMTPLIETLYTILWSKNI